MITILGCETTKSATTDISLEGGWELVLFPSGGKEFVEIFGQRKPELQFDELNKKLTGNSGCNHISGGYTRDGKTIKISDNMIMTKMACPGYDETVFIDALRKVKSYKIENDQLSLIQNDMVLMTFSKKKSK